MLNGRPAASTHFSVPAISMLPSFSKACSNARFRPLIISLIVLALVPSMASAAGASDSAAKKGKEYALLFGTVWGPDDRPVPGVVVKIRRAEDKKAKWTLVSDARGECAQRVPPGKEDYVIWAETKGKKDAKAVETKVHVENDERVDFGLHLN